MKADKSDKNPTPTTESRKRKTAEKPAADLLDTQSDREAYRLKLTKWADGALCTVRSSIFWMILHVSEKVRSPLSHFLAWVQKASNDRMIQQLVTHKAAEFQLEFDQLLQTFDTWFAETVQEARAHDVPRDIMTLLRTLSFKLLVHASGSFHMRIGMHVQRWPFKLFLLLASAPTVRCSRRQRVAKELLDTPDADLEANCRKLKSRCRSELEYVASEGKFDMQNPVLYGIVSTMAELLKGDTQLVESINSIIRLVGERCPSIDLQTMSARIVVKKAAKGELGEAGAAAKRWSNVLKLAKPLLLELTAAGTTFQSILREEGRFAQPTRTSMACLDDALRNTDITKALPDLKQDSHKRWATSQARDLKKAVDAARRESKRLQAYAPLQPGSLVIVCLRPASNRDQRFWLLHVGSYRSMMFLRQLNARSDGSLTLSEDTEIFTSVELLVGWRNQCFDAQAPETVEALCFSAVHLRGQALTLLDSKETVNTADSLASLSPLSLDNAFLGEAAIAAVIKKSKDSKGSIAASASDVGPAVVEDRPAETAEMEGGANDDIGDGGSDEGLLLSGYGFSDDVEQSTLLAKEMDEELGTSVVAAMNAGNIKRHQSTVDAVQADVLDEAVAKVQEIYGKSNIVLTPDELEEEALLLVIRELNAGKTGAESSEAQPKKAAKTAVADSLWQGGRKQKGKKGPATAKAAKKDHQCLEDDEMFLQRLLADQWKDDDDNEDQHEEGKMARAGVLADAASSSSSFAPPRAYEQWKKATTKTLESLVDRLSRCRLGIAHNDEVSFLVSLPAELQQGSILEEADEHAGGGNSLELVCVRWTDAGNRLGRSCRLDSQDRVVWAPATMFGVAVISEHWPANRFSDLIHATGAQSRKYRGSLRDGFPEPVKRFLAFARLLMRYANGDDSWMSVGRLFW
ncbi:unnamed protein product [Symbiodinium sp. CCMP2456]|nr:unnamed protein product [Symbiodinium sp. CCMP2456]